MTAKYFAENQIKNALENEGQNEGVLLSSLNVVLGNSFLLLQSFGISLFKMFQEKRRLNYLMQEAIVSRNKALATYKRAKLR